MQNERGPAGARHPHRRGDLQLQVVQPTKVLQRYAGRHRQNFKVELFNFRAVENTQTTDPGARCCLFVF